MKCNSGLAALGIVCVIGLTGHARADVVTYDANVQNGVYYGSGNFNGGWTISNNTDNVVSSTYNGDDFEVGLRAKNYGGAVITPEPGTGIYDSTTGFASSASPRAVWSWDFSIDNLGGGGLSGLTAEMTISDANSSNTNTFNLLNPLFGNAVGDHGNGQQNSENMEFATISLPGYNPWYGDSYTFSVQLLDNGNVIATDTITVNAVPEPATMTLFAFGLAGLAAARRRRASAGSR
jgi:hypothetical protein